MELNRSDSSLDKVLARKWRPKNFSQVIGQETTVKALKHALKTNRLHHAYLLTGSRGVGKTTIARLVAKAVNCLSGEKNEPCTICKTCEEIDAGSFIDVIEIDAASNRGVEEIQHILEQTQYAPSLGLKKVIVIDEVHMLSNHAFNAMLKTLEEPPDHIIFILATTDPQKIPATVVSRCLQFVLRNISSKLVFSHLSDILKVEEIYFEESALKEISLAAHGSMRDALSIYDRMVSFSNQQLTVKSVSENLNVLDHETFFSVTSLILKHDIPALLLAFDELVQKGFDEIQFVSGLGLHFRILMVSKENSTLKLLEVSNTTQEKYKSQTQEAPLSLLLEAIDLTSKCELDYRNTKNKRLLIELCLMQIASLRLEEKTTDL